jgi:hypothetical protein
VNLMDALNSRLDDTADVVPTENFMITQTVTATPTTPPPVSAMPGWTRPLRPGEVGMNDVDKYPKVPYSDEELKALLQRTAKGALWMLDNFDTPEATQRLGMLIDIVDATHLLLYARMADTTINS